MITSLTRLKAPNPLRMLLAVLAVAAAAAVLAACSSSGSSSAGRQRQHQHQQSRRDDRGQQPEDRHYRRRHRADQRAGLHAVLLRPRHGHQVGLQRDVRDGLAAGQGRRPRPVTSTFGTIKRADGSTQLIFNGHPLYTFTGDTAPGTDKGNGVNAFGGLWHEVPTSGAAPPAAPRRAPAAEATEPADRQAGGCR